MTCNLNLTIFGVNMCARLVYYYALWKIIGLTYKGKVTVWHAKIFK